MVAFRGSIAGTTFQRNRAGEIARARGRTTKQPTPKQSIAQNEHEAFIAMFAALSPADKALWDAYALANTKENAFGQSKILTGQNWYESTNYYRQLAGASILDQPPTHTLPTPPFTISATITPAPGVTGSLTVTFTPMLASPNRAIAIYTTPPLTRNTSSLRSHWRLTFASAAAPFTTVDITSEYETTHGIGIPTNTTRYNFMIGVMARLIWIPSGIAGVGVIDLPAVQQP